MVEAGWVKLIEFEISHSTASAPCHRDAVPAGSVGIGGVSIRFAGPARGQHHRFGAEGFNASRFGVEQVGATDSAPRLDHIN